MHLCIFGGYVFVQLCVCNFVCCIDAIAIAISDCRVVHLQMWNLLFVFVYLQLCDVYLLICTYVFVGHKLVNGLPFVGFANMQAISNKGHF